ncbi:helix-turn-helix domain-containing protein [Flagellimonas sp.]|uniref:helix-turn-helix domain-containing protein n=1 Tax=Flagellimonas sp. TaxID=2058762 RepID=UPI003B5AF00F
MKFVFIVGAVQAFFLTLVVMNKKNKSKGDYVMVILLVLMGFLLVGYALEVMGLDTEYPVFLGFYTAMPTLFGPLVYLYVVSYTKKSQKFNPWFLLHALPYIVFTIAVFLQLTLYSEGSIVDDKNVIEDTKKPVFLIMSFFRVFVGVIYLIASFLVLKKHSKRIGNHFSYTEHIDLKWLRYVIISMVVLWSTIVVANILYHFDTFLPYRQGDNIIFTVITIIVFLTGYYGIKQQIIFTPSITIEGNSDRNNLVADKQKTKKQYLHSGLSEEDSKAQLQRLLKYMKEEKPYLNGKLSLPDVADQLDISTNHLSQIINGNLNKNFFDFINGYRVDLMKKKMLDASNDHLTLLGMAYESGFNSKSSFNNIFKKTTGLTPSQFLKAKTS